MSGRDHDSAVDITEAVTRRSYGKLVAILAARTGDVAGAEDALSDAFTSALVDWPRSGLPQNPEAWLLSAARRKQIDTGRHSKVSTAATDHLQLMADELQSMANDRQPISDERLALMFACAHPAIEPGIRAPLILQTILGFNAQTIGSAFLVAPATMGARLSRAKNKIRAAGIPLRVPDRADLPERLADVLGAIYGAYAYGWSDPAGIDGSVRNLAEEAIWLGRLITKVLPREPEALGLLALMLYSQSRLNARRDRQGEFIPLAEQKVTEWNKTMIVEAEGLLLSASTLGAFGRYQLEAAIQSAHIAGRRGGATDWPAIERFYDALCAITDSPVTSINRAIAIAETRGASEGLAAMPVPLAGDRLNEYQPYWAARAELLIRLCDFDAAKEAYGRAIGLEADPSVRRFLQTKKANLERRADSHSRRSFSLRAFDRIE
ncbi:RNA polymerase sigma-70 factor (ECF subfamily) [Devosia sp. UYZn731]|uniref:RNA polymerase sigma factor n=1 Tax=Devosia sp. UYZn731 TaxID=3156345 RepID=UPI003392448B